MKITTKGQVTIPRHIRKFLGLSASSEVDFAIRDDEVVLRKAGEETPRGRFRALRGSKKGFRTTGEWMRETRGD